MEKVIIPLVIILVIVGVIAGVVFYVKNKVRKFSQDLFGTDSLVEGWKKQEEELVVERKPVVTILTVLGILRTALCCILAAIGLFTMLHPGLRQVFVNLIHAFFMEAGFLG